jgi:kynureninase
MDTTREWAIRKDRDDPLRHFRERFYVPDGCIYMDGNSLGLASRDAEACILRVLEEWKTLGIGGWLDAKPAWFTFPEHAGELVSPLIGAKAEEVVLAGSTTANLHVLVATFYRPQGTRKRILADEQNFPSDLYALSSQISLHGGSPENLILAKSRDGHTLDEDAIIDLMDDSIALVLLPSVLYRSGQLLDMERLTRAARERGIPIGFDCSHSIGSVPHRFDDWGTDFAFFCSYKHLNGGPGAPAFLYVNERHFGRTPGLAGWFGFRKERQFDMALEFDPQPTAGAWQLGTPHMMSAAAVEGSLRMFAEAGIDGIRKKSIELTGYLMDLIDAELSKPPYDYSYSTPRDASRRGGHVAVEHPREALRICEALKTRGIIPDFRPDRVIRIAPVAMYSTFEEVWLVARALREIIDSLEYERFPKGRRAVS